MLLTNNRDMGIIDIIVKILEYEAEGIAHSAIPIALIASLASSAVNMFNSYRSNKTAEEQAESLRQLQASELARNESERQMLENQDPTQTKSGRAIISEAEEKLQRQVDSERGADAVMGGSGIRSQRAQDTYRKSLGDVYKEVISNYENNITSRLNMLEAARTGIVNQQMQGIQNSVNAANEAANQAMNSAINGIVSGIESLDNKDGIFSGNGTKPETEVKS